MIIFRHFDKISSNIFHIICQNLIRQFLKVTFNEIFCKLALFLFNGTPPQSTPSGSIGLAILALKCQLASSARSAARSAIQGAGPIVKLSSMQFRYQQKILHVTHKFPNYFQLFLIFFHKNEFLVIFVMFGCQLCSGRSRNETIGFGSGIFGYA